MNHLAHIYLARSSDEWMVGGFIADAIKGKKYFQYPEGIAAGILLHRFIDEFTDTHAIVRKSKSLLREQFGLLSGLIVDVYYDHFLAKNWKEYSEVPLEKFTVNCYSVFEEHSTIMPVQYQKMLPYMKKDNWLLNYANLSGIRQAFEGMSKRIKIPNKLYEAPEALLENYNEFEEEFREFFPKLSAAVEKRINQ